MPFDEEDFVQQIHASGRQVVVATTGGGSRAIARLLAVPGALRSILEALVPYAAPALARFLGGQPDQYCSPATARAMAMAAYRRALDDDAPGAAATGLACTASLASDRPKQGPHRLHIAAQTRDATRLVSLELEKGIRTRDQEETLTANVMLNLLAECCGLTQLIPLALTVHENLQASGVSAPPKWQALLVGEIDRLRVNPLGEPATPPKAIFSGAFHPLHKGHLGMAAVAARMLSETVEFEIPIINADKPPLDYLEIDSRVRQFAADQPVWLSRAATFSAKSLLFPGATFVVGVDTIERVAEARFYGGDPSSIERAMQTIADQGCRFLVFGRVDAERFRTLADLALPPAVARLCREVPGDLFRADISSTALRRQADPAG